MALNIGDTVENLQTRMSYEEFLLWCSYRNKFGPLSPVRKYDQPAGLISATLINANGGKARPIDFMPYSKPVEKEQSEEDILKALLAGGKHGR